MPDMAAVAAFIKNAEVMGIRVAEAKDLAAAMTYALAVCDAKDFCDLLPVNEEESFSERRRASGKVFAAPGLEDAVFAFLSQKGEAKGFSVIKDGLRDHLAGIDVAFTFADIGIAETATCAVASGSEEVRVATMVCEIHVVALQKSAILPHLDDAAEYLNRCFSSGPAYTAFISGPSRTADIERTLAIGVHGPLELHVVLLEE